MQRNGRQKNRHWLAATNYTFDSAVLNYVIKPKAIDGSMVTIENPEYVYDNTNKTPVVTLKDGANTLAVNTDYEILSTSTTTAKEYGDYNIIVQGIGNYTGQYTIPWAIVPDAPPVISGATNGASYSSGTTINITVSDISGLASVTINGESKPVTGNTYTQTISGAGSYTITATDTAGNTSTLSFTIKSGGSGGSGGSGDSGGSGGSGGGSSGGGGSNNPSGNTPSSDNGNKPTDNNVPSNNPEDNQPSDTARNNKKTSDSKSNNQTSNNGQDDESIDDKDSEGSTTNDKEDVTTNVTNDDFNCIFFNEERKISYGDGTVIVSVDVEDELGEKADYSGSIVGDTESIMKAVLTQDDIDAVSSGETVYIKLVVTLISEDVPQTDKEQIEAALTTIADQELIPGTYYDLKVMKSIGGGDWEKLTTLNDDIEITLDIDKDLQAEGRTFYILRSHEGAVTMLFDLDEAP